MHTLSKYIATNIICLLIALPNTIQSTPSVDEYTSDQKPSSNFRVHIKDIAEVITAAGTGIISTAATALFLKETIPHLEKVNADAKLLIPVLLTGLAIYYIIQKMPKLIMKNLLGRNYHTISYNTIMLLASSNLVAMHSLF
ncbi:MAG TPA: hypothetical protein VGW78_05545 [Candidatus Babeliales bacterium]|nr:hypothetical protein [Candidatus Babeliales bacterium]